MAAPHELRLILQDFGKSNSHTIGVYEEGGGYQALKKILVTEKEKWDPESIIGEIKKSNLRGRGGAGFPTGLKWSFLPKGDDKPKYVVCNADESEPGTFKDRYVLEELPHGMIEGIIIAGLALNSQKGFIYFRGEFLLGWQRVEAALKEAYAKGYLGENILGSGKTFDIVTFRGAGAYICGEETALLESLEGKRGHPRLKPPFPAVKGLYGCPTTVNNVETFAAVPHIITKGADFYSKIGLGDPKSSGTKLFSVSGHVKNPGVFEVPLGLPLKKFIYETCGGLRDGRKLKAVVPGGSSTPILTAEEAEDAILDYEGMAKLGTMLGSGGLIVLDDTANIVEFTFRVAAFYRYESCGQCTPCREGSKWIYDILTRLMARKADVTDVETMLSFTQNMVNGTTICPFSDAMVMAVMPIVNKFRPEFEAYMQRAEVTAS